jgi:thioredoxin-dependent peroxiredoxin
MWLTSRVRVLAVTLYVMQAVVTASVAGPSSVAKPSAPPAAGDEAKDFELADLAGNKVKLSSVAKTGPVVLVMLRGFPGYQCPACSAQAARYLERAQDFSEARATVLLVYPGPAAELKLHAAEFANGKNLPENFRLLLDPAYVMTQAYRLRWNARNETAYPSTFVIDAERKIRFAKISKSHGDRARVEDVLKTLSELD